MGQRDLVLGLGELLWDCFGEERRPGGAPANVAYQARQLGLDATVASRVGTDAAGDELLAFLQSQGLPTDLIQRDAEHPTGRVTVSGDDPDHPTYYIHEDVAWDNLELTPALGEVAANAAAICFGSLAQRTPQGRSAVQACLDATEASCLKVFDVNLRPPHVDRSVIESSLQRADVLKLNESEVRTLTDLLELGIAEPKFFARTIEDRFETRWVCVTRGERGCLVSGAGEVAEAEAVEVETADAVGAGDAFSAALIFALLREMPLEAAAEFCNRVAADVASKPGAMPDTRDAFARIKAVVGVA